MGALAIIPMLPGCLSGTKNNRSPSQSPLAQVTLYDPIGIEFDRFEFKLEGEAPGGTQFSATGLKKGEGQLKASVVPGPYKITLAYYKNNEKTFASDLCADGVRNDRQTFAPGPNMVDLMICDKKQNPTPTKPPEPPKPGEPQKPDQSDVTIKPTVPTKPNEQNTFSINGTTLMDPTGKPFVIRGVNNPHNYWKNEAFNALPKIKEFGFNSVRIVWCADTLIRSGRCDQKDIHPVSELERILEKMRSLQLVAVLNLQNATGSNNRDDLDKMADYLLKPEVKSVLIKYQDMLLINIANEWYGDWDKSTNYIEAYRKVIPALRDGGLPHVLMVDARGWGQDFSSVVEHGKDLIGIDPNVMVSSHLYDLYGTAKAINDVFTQVEKLKIPFVVGEFACSHGSKGAVPCVDIISQANRTKAGLLAWSYSGNSSELEDLDLVDVKDWKTPTSFGKKIMASDGSFMKESKTACFFNPTKTCP